jgi:hypothetical protein
LLGEAPGKHGSNTPSTITRADFLRALRREMPSAMSEIRRAGVGPTDIQQAAIGPGIGIFTRHAQVINTDNTSMVVKDALKLINQVCEEITTPSSGEYGPSPGRNSQNGARGVPSLASSWTETKG